MIKKLIDGISIKLYNTFGDNYNIYADTVEQNLNTPAFFIKNLQTSSTQIIGNRYFRRNNFDIHFFPEKDSNLEMQEVASKLITELEYITLVDGDLIKAFNINYEIVDKVLHFFISYNLYVNKIEEEQDPMETIEVTTGTEE